MKFELPKSNVADRAIRWAFPGWAHKRLETRARLAQYDAMADSYEGAGRGRDLDGWEGTSGSADADLDPNTLAMVRQRSRDRYRNDGVARAIVDALTDNVVGSGIGPKVKLDIDELGITRDTATELARQARRVYENWSLCSDASERLDFQSQQHQMFASMLVNGDCFVVPTVTEHPERTQFELRLEVIEADRVDTPTDKLADVRTRSGIELSATTGEPLAYWIAEAHPGDASLAFTPGQRKFRRVERWNANLNRPNVIHLYRQRRPGQTRGEPLLAPVLKHFLHVADYMEAEEIAAKVAACFTAYITTEDPIKMAMSRMRSDSPDGTREEELQPGLQKYLRPGEQVQIANPSRPNSNFGAYVDRCIRFICAGTGIPFEVATRDFHDTTYSQARAAIIEAARLFQVWQLFLTRHVLQPVWQMVLEEAWSKNLYAAGGDFLARPWAWCRSHWILPGRGWIDPKAEIEAAQVALAMRITTREQLASQNGQLFEDVALQLSEEEQMLEDLGLGAPALQPPGSSQPGQQTPAVPANQDKNRQDGPPKPPAKGPNQ